MGETPVVGNIYRVIGNRTKDGYPYHALDTGALVVCVENDFTDMCEYRVLGSDLVQFIYSSDLELETTIEDSPPTTVYKRIIQWASDRNLLEGSTRKDQMVKLMEEVGELAAGIAKGNEPLVKDSIGDALVVLTILAEQSGTSIDECLDLAWCEIKDRKGSLVNGIFIKEG